MLIVGDEDMIRLCLHFGGRRIPSRRRILAWMRARMIVADWLNRGYSHSELALKYQVSRVAVARIISRYLARRRRAQVAMTSPGLAP